MFKFHKRDFLNLSNVFSAAQTGKLKRIVLGTIKWIVSCILLHSEQFLLKHGEIRIKIEYAVKLYSCIP